MDYAAITVIVVYLVAVTAIGSVLALLARTELQLVDAVAGGGMSSGHDRLWDRRHSDRWRRDVWRGGHYVVSGERVEHVVATAINSVLWLARVGRACFSKCATSQPTQASQRSGELFTISQVLAPVACQWITSLCVQTEYAIVNLIEAYVIGVVLSTLTPLSMLEGTMVAAVIFATYVSLGGLWGTAVTNAIHCSVILAGLLAVGLMGIGQLGGWDAVTAQDEAAIWLRIRREARWSRTGASSSSTGAGTSR